MKMDEFSSKYIESNFIFIETNRDIAYFESIMGRCFIENYKLSHKEGDIISGYYYLNTPYIYFSTEEFAIIKNNYTIENRCLSYMVAILLSFIITIVTIGIYRVEICGRYDNQIDKFFDPYGELIKNLEAKIDRLEKKLNKDD